MLTRLRTDREHGKRNNWLLIKRHDGYEQDEDADALLNDDKSVASGRSMAAIESGKGPNRSPSCWRNRSMRTLFGSPIEATEQTNL